MIYTAVLKEVLSVVPTSESWRRLSVRRWSTGTLLIEHGLAEQFIGSSVSGQQQRCKSSSLVGVTT